MGYTKTATLRYFEKEKTKTLWNICLLTPEHSDFLPRLISFLPRGTLYIFLSAGGPSIFPLGGPPPPMKSNSGGTPPISIYLGTFPPKRTVLISFFSSKPEPPPLLFCLKNFPNTNISFSTETYHFRIEAYHFRAETNHFRTEAYHFRTDSISRFQSRPLPPWPPIHPSWLF